MDGLDLRVGPGEVHGFLGPNGAGKSTTLRVLLGLIGPTSLTGLRGGSEERLRRELIDEFEFDPRRKARTYSKGNRQKVALIAAFARPARLYLLDEPSAGLDPVMDSVFRRQVQRVSADGATVLLSSHILSEVEQLCGRVTIIRSGKAVETGTLAELRHLKLTHFSIGGRCWPADSLAPGAGRPDRRGRCRV